MPTTLENWQILSSTSMNLQEAMMARRGRHANIPRALMNLVLHIDRSSRVMMARLGSHANNPEATVNLVIHINRYLRRDNG
jgi:hypothetical protein